MSTCVSSPLIREDRLSRFNLSSRKGPIGLLRLLSLASPLSRSILDTAGKLREACGLFSFGLRCRLNCCQVATINDAGCQVPGSIGARLPGGHDHDSRLPGGTIPGSRLPGGHDATIPGARVPCCQVAGSMGPRWSRRAVS